MTNVDQFESVFRAASRELFHYEPIEIASVLVLTDLGDDEAELLADQAKTLLAVLESTPGGGRADIDWRVAGGDTHRTVPALLEVVETSRPDLIVTYRHLHSEGWKWPFTLGEHVEVLTQATSTPIVVLPHPEANRASDHAMKDTSEVMAITDHLAGDHRLVNWATRMTQEGGRLFLTHVEDEVALDRIIDAIGKIPELDTDVARVEIRKQLLKIPHDYVTSCRKELEDAGLSITIEEIVTIGRRLASYQELIDAHAVDLLVFNTKDEDQLAMHGLAYPLAVELRRIPLLML